MSKTRSTVWVTMRAALVAVVCAALAGCAVEGEIGDDEGVSEAVADIYTPNSLSTLALTSSAFVNPEAMSELTSHSLRTLESPGPAVKAALTDPRPRTLEFVKYLASCALPAGQFITVGSTNYYGDYGLAPGWATGPSVAKEQECVSACMLARNNAFGKRVIISMLSNGCGLPAAPTVKTMIQEPSTGAAIASFGGCSIWDMFSTSVATNCSWKADYIVRGVAGRSDTITAPGTTYIRVCDGLAGCNHGAARYLGSGYQSLTVTIPHSGVMAVMVRDYHAGLSTLAVASHSNVSSFAETDIWRWREGGFFGNIFTTGMSLMTRHELDGADRTRDTKGAILCSDPAGGEDDLLGCKAAHGVVFPRMYAVTSSIWTDGLARMKDRVCAGPGKDLCAASPIGMAADYCDVSDLVDGVPVDVDYYDSCKDPSKVKSPRVITTRLTEADRCSIGMPCSVIDP